MFTIFFLLCYVLMLYFFYYDKKVVSFFWNVYNYFRYPLIRTYNKQKVNFDKCYTHDLSFFWNVY